METQAVRLAVMQEIMMLAEELAVETQAERLAVMQEIPMLAEELAVEMQAVETQAVKLAVMEKIPMGTKAWSAIAYKSKKCPQKKKKSTA